LSKQSTALTTGHAIDALAHQNNRETRGYQDCLYRHLYKECNKQTGQPRLPNQYINAGQYRLPPNLLPAHS
jgi:hypothetical protein